MKQLLVVVVLGGLLVVSAPVLAETTESSETQTTKPTETTQNQEKIITPEELKARILEKKARYKTKLTNKEIQRLVTKCGPSQVKINTFLQGRFKNDTPYQAKYEAYINRLDKLSEKLKQNNVDTTELDAQIIVLKQKYEVFKAAVTTFRNSVSDAKEIDCKTDPTGFKAALEDARAKAVLVKQANADLESYAKTTIKATLEKIKALRS